MSVFSQVVQQFVEIESDCTVSRYPAVIVPANGIARLSPSVDSTVMVSPSQFVALVNSSAEHQIMLSYIRVRVYRDTRMKNMRSILDYDMQDVSVMIGAGSLAGAVANMVFTAVSGAAAPQPVAILAAAGGFIGGRFLSAKLRKSRHG